MSISSLPLQFPPLFCLRLLVFILLLVTNTLALGNQTVYSVDDYYRLLKAPPLRIQGEDQDEKQLQAFFRQAWPDRGDAGYIASAYVRTPQERQEFMQALERLTNDRLAAAGNPTPGSEAYSRAIFGQFWSKGQLQPLAHRALLLSLDGQFDEQDIWQLVVVAQQCHPQGQQKAIRF